MRNLPLSRRIVSRVDAAAQRHAFAFGLVLGALPFLAAYLIA